MNALRKNVMHAALCEASIRNTKQKKGAQTGELWRQKHAKLRAQFEIPTDTAKETRLEDVTLLASQVVHKKGQDTYKLITDTSQDGTRKAWSTSVVRSITTSSDLYHHGRARRLVVPELYALMGFDSPELSGLSTTQSKDLLGKAMAVPVVSMVLCSPLLHVSSAPGST